MRIESKLIKVSGGREDSQNAQTHSDETKEKLISQLISTNDNERIIIFTITFRKEKEMELVQRDIVMWDFSG